VGEGVEEAQVTFYEDGTGIISIGTSLRVQFGYNFTESDEEELNYTQHVIFFPMYEVHITRLAILLAVVVASSIVAVFSTGTTTISAFAQQQSSAIDIEIPDLPQIPEIPQGEDLIPCLPPPECLLPGAEVCIQVCWPFNEE
jgi:hypothetical protein